MFERHYTVEQVAELSGDSPYTVRKLLRLKKLRGHKNGTGHQSNPWRIPESAVAEYLGARTPERPTDAR